ncbi:VTT domain-containing protein [Halobacillus sp. ACCC02827]|uniref:TVP38/TMEM64 family protein n=1 Tax=Bacillaceae TaxID=186817 RepID=UPI0002A52150|nr:MULTISPECIES: VTT domain-containing protein [Bacillaceae]ELK47257.1 DedA family protein [Halobacillus sp. BAB-2008]QHT47373.1 TVP38/TMEM64 family protein [Bacillus sp. SB49]WJE14596.1 VTT domain-containing protein [Halobacillus sp. ACCC02827]
MGEITTSVLAWLEQQEAWAPLLFIGIHLLRPFLFLPVMLVCITGGVLFGPIAGTAYSVIGTMLSSLVFYKMIRILPSGLKKLKRVKEKWLKKQTNLSVKQVAVLRLVPFIHFHLLSYCLLEISSDFKEYTKSSLFANFPLAVVYTSVGQWITLLSLPMMIIFSGALIGLTFLIRKKYEVVLWRDFFQPAP